MTIVEAVARLIPGVLGHKHSIKEETFSPDLDYIEYPQYTRPEVFKAGKSKWRVPKVLLSGDHKKILEWRGRKGKK